MSALYRVTNSRINEHSQGIMNYCAGDQVTLFRTATRVSLYIDCIQTILKNLPDMFRCRVWCLYEKRKLHSQKMGRTKALIKSARENDINEEAMLVEYLMYNDLSGQDTTYDGTIENVNCFLRAASSCGKVKASSLELYNRQKMEAA